MFRGDGEEALEESVEPFRGCSCGQGKGEEDGDGFGAHGGEVAEATGEAAVSGGLGRVPAAAEVDVFERKVGGDADFVVGPGAEESAVVADAEFDGAGAGSLAAGLFPDGLDEREFAGESAGFGCGRHEQLRGQNTVSS